MAGFGVYVAFIEPLHIKDYGAICHLLAWGDSSYGKGYVTIFDLIFWDSG